MSSINKDELIEAIMKRIEQNKVKGRSSTKDDISAIVNNVFANKPITKADINKIKKQKMNLKDDEKE